MSDFYAQLAATKRPWLSIDPTPGVVQAGAESTIGRALALRCLEIPVGEFITQSSRKEFPVPDSARSLLLSNVVDEVRHDEQLELAAKAFNLSSDEDTKVAESFLSAWQDLEDHPLVKATVIERSIFFVVLPIFRMFGTPSLRTISADISGDEQVHVAANSQLCKDLGLNYSKKADRLRREVVAWLTEGLNVQGNEKGNMSFWLRQSTKLLEEGKTEELNETKRTRVVSFFEFSNSQLPYYSA